jgi:hypothetical protein
MIQLRELIAKTHKRLGVPLTDGYKKHHSDNIKAVFANVSTCDQAWNGKGQPRPMHAYEDRGWNKFLEGVTGEVVTTVKRGKK